jgi:hypothetical protein
MGGNMWIGAPQGMMSSADYHEAKDSYTEHFNIESINAARKANDESMKETQKSIEDHIFWDVDVTNRNYKYGLKHLEDVYLLDKNDKIIKTNIEIIRETPMILYGWMLRDRKYWQEYGRGDIPTGKIAGRKSYSSIQNKFGMKEARIPKNELYKYM